MSEYSELDKYFPDFRTKFSKKEFQEATTRTDAIIPALKGKIVEKIKDNPKYPEYNNYEGKKRVILNLMVKEIRKYFTSKKVDVGVPQSKSGAVTNALDKLIKKYLAGVKYRNIKITPKNIMDSEFDEKNVTVTKTQKGNVANIDGLKEEYRNLNEGLEPLHKPLKRNMRIFFSEVQKQIKDLSEGKVRQQLESRLKIGIDIKSIFNAKSMKNFEKREDAYEYWGEINKKLVKLEENLDELNQKLIQTKDKETEEIRKLTKFLNNKGNNLNYIKEFEPKKISVKGLDSSAYFAFEAFLNYIGGYMEKEDIDSLSRLNVESNYSKEGNPTGQTSDMEEEIEEDSLPTEIMSAKDILDEKQFLDPLGIIYFRKELKELGAVNTNLVKLKEELEGYFEDLNTESEYPDLDVENADALFENFLNKLEDIENISSGTKFYLPVFMSEDTSLSKEYSDLIGESREIDRNIKEFLDVFSDFLQIDKANLSREFYDEFLGAGSGGKDKSDRNLSMPWFSYSGLMTTSRGRQRYSSENIKAANNLNEDIIVSINSISQLIADCFLLPQFSPYRAGINLPFERDIALRVISATRPLKGKKYKAISVINKRLLERDTAFVSDEDIDDVIKYLEELAGSDNIKNYNALYDRSSELSETLKDVIDEESLDNQIDASLGSVLGSIYRLLTPEQKEQAGNRKKFKGKEVETLYNKLLHDDPEDSYVMRAFIDALRLRAKNMSNSDKIDRLLSLIDRVAKSILQKKLLEAHDALRILKSKELYHSKKNLNSFDDMNNMIMKMEEKYNIDMNATEIIGIVKAVDSFEGIAEDYGIDSEHVYIVKANFR